MSLPPIDEEDEFTEESVCALTIDDFLSIRDVHVYEKFVVDGYCYFCGQLVPEHTRTEIPPKT